MQFAQVRLVHIVAIKENTNLHLFWTFSRPRKKFCMILRPDFRSEKLGGSTSCVQA